MRKVLLLLVVLVAWLPVPAGAHASLVGSDPEDGAVLESAPAAVSLEFNEPVTRSDVAVTAPDGSTLPVEVASVDRTVTATLGDADQRGTYTVAFRVMSADGHPVAGSRTFEVTSGRDVEQVAQAVEGESFVQRHTEHVLWAAAAALVAVLLIVWPLLGRRKKDA